MTFPPRERHPEPLDEEALLNPTVEEALATVGTLIHWVTSDPKLAAGFAAYVEHCPGDLRPELVHAVLGATHDVLSPGCPAPIPPWAGR